MAHIGKVFLLFSLLIPLFPSPALTQRNAPTVTMAFIEGEPGTLDPQAAETINEFLVLRNVYEGLVSYNPRTLQPKAALAEKWGISKDGTIYTFHLRQDVKFHNGRTLTANDVKYSLERLANPQTGKSYTHFILDHVKGIAARRDGTANEVEGLKVIDDQTFMIMLDQPVAAFLNQLSLPGAFIVPAENAQKANFDRNPVGTGPFKFVQWVPQTQVTLEANTDYWGEASKIKFVVLSVISNSLQQVTDFKARKVDIAVAPAFEIQELQQDPILVRQLQRVPPLAINFLILNLTDPILRKVEVRQALNIAINRQALLDGVLKWQGWAAQGVFPPLLNAFDSEPIFVYNPAKAKALLAQAGYPDGLTLNATLGTDETDKRIMGVIQAQLADIGVNLTIDSMTKPHADAARNACSGQMFLSTWTGDYADPDDFAQLLIDSDATRVNCGYGVYTGVAEIKALLIQAAAMPRDMERDAFYRKAQRLAMEQAVVVPIYYRFRSVLISSILDSAYLDATLSINFANIRIKPGSDN